MRNSLLLRVLDRGCGEIELQLSAVQRGLKVLHGEGLIIFIHITEFNGCKINRFLLVWEHSFLVMEWNELPVSGVRVGCGAVERPGHLLCTGLFYLSSLIFGEREDQGFAGLLCKTQK